MDGSALTLGQLNAVRVASKAGVKPPAIARQFRISQSQGACEKRHATEQSTTAAYVPLSFAPGEAYQFDWSHEVVLLNGVTVTVKVARVRLCHSRMPFVHA